MMAVEKKAERAEKKKIRQRILNLQDKNCKDCKKVAKDSRNLKYCLKVCPVGIKIKELGDHLAGDEVTEIEKGDKNGPSKK